MIKYRTNGFVSVERVEVERETKVSVWLRGQQYPKKGQFTCFFETAREAADHCIDLAQARLAEAREELNKASQQVDECAERARRVVDKMIPLLRGTEEPPAEKIPDYTNIDL